MNRRCLSAILLPVLGFVASWAGPAAAMGPPLTFVEDFRTTTWRDQTGTDAVWDTALGRLSLAPFSPATIGNAWGLGQVEGAAVSGSIACAASSDAGLLVFDISDPSHLELVAEREVDGEAHAVAIVGTTAYVAIGVGGLAIFDIARPDETVQVGQYVTADEARDVAVVGGLAYVASLGAGLTIIDVSDPHAPTLVAQVATYDRALGVVVTGDHAFVADYRAGVAVVDVNDPAHPQLLSHATTAAPTTALAVSGDLLAAATGAGGVRLYDITNASSPVPAGSIATYGLATDVTFRNRMLLTTTTGPRLYAHDVNDPALAVEKWAMVPGGPARGLDTSGDLAVVALDGAGLEVVRICEAADPVTSVLDYYGSLDFHSPRDVAMSGDVAYIVTEPLGLMTMRLPVHGSVQVLATASTPGNAVGVAVDGNLACVADSLSGLRTFDVTNPAAPVALGGYDTPGQAVDVAICGNLALVADGSGDLQIIDVSDPSAPVLRGVRSLPGTANAVAVSGTMACVTDGGLRLVDISIPGAPVLRGSWTNFNGGSAAGVAVSGAVAYVTAGAAGLFVIDIRNPTAPVLLSVMPVTASYLPYCSPSLYGRKLVVLEAGGGNTSSWICIFDISDPAQPSVIVRQNLISFYVNSLLVADDYLLMVDGPAGANYIGNFSCRALAQYDVTGALSGEAASLNIVPESPFIVCARLTSEQSGDVTWELDGTGIPRDIAPNGGWRNIETSGYGLKWFAELDWDVSNPTVTRVQIDWRLREARIDSIVDVRPDQGGWANLWFTGSGYDIQNHTITGYNVYRRVDDKELAARVRAAKAIQAPSVLIEGVTCPTGTEVGLDGLAYVVNDEAAKDMPPGVWSVVSSFWPTYQDRYVVTVPTVADDGPDGPAFACYYVLAIQGSTASFFASAPDSGRSVDNIAPGVPEGLAAAYADGGVRLDWLPAPEADFQYFRIYRGTEPGFVPTPAGLVDTTASTTFSDAAPDPWDNYYVVTTVDHAGNESAPAAPAAMSGVDDSVTPSAFRLGANEPNPFNAGTMIRWDVPIGGAPVSLAIYDLRGARVRTLVDGAQPAGRHSLHWDGRDDRGRTLATGVYFCRLATAVSVQVIKMSLIQ